MCGPFRTDLASRTDLCGAFKVPTLRNVAVTAPYFHNGRFKTLKEVVGFYVRRDTNPEEWYPLNADGSVHKFDDLPPQYHRNVNTTEVPYNRRRGDAPALTPDEIDLVVEFLEHAHRRLQAMKDPAMRTRPPLLHRARGSHRSRCRRSPMRRRSPPASTGCRRNSRRSRPN